MENLTKSKFQGLHESVLWRITEGLDPISLHKLCATTKKFQKIYKDPAFWKWKLDQNFPDYRPIPDEDLKTVYQELFRVSIKSEIGKIRSIEKSDPKLLDLVERKKKLEAKIRELEAEVETLDNGIYEIMGEYSDKVGNIKKMFRKLESRDLYEKFVPPPVKIVINENFIKKYWEGGFPSMTIANEEIKRYFDFPLVNNLMILVEDINNFSRLMVFIYKDCYNLSHLPKIPENFKILANDLGISAGHLLELYGLDSDRFEKSTGMDI